MTYGFRILAIVLGISLMIMALGACGSVAPEPDFRSEEAAAPASVEEAVPPARKQIVPEAPAVRATAVPQQPAMEIVQGVPSTPQEAPGQGFNTIGGSAPVNDAAYDLTFFRHYGVNPFIDTEDDYLSTFAMDVDTASYTVARRFVQDGNLPHPDSVRVEEFVNYFDQGYEPPAEDAFAIHMDGSPSPFGRENLWLLRVGLQGHQVSARDRKDSTLIFAIDVSGSMGREDRLELVKRSLNLLVNELRRSDKVGIVIYGDRGKVVLQPTSGRNQEAILEVIDSLSPGGSTFVEDGLRLAYRMAAEEVEDGRITRVMLLSDGVGNVGNTGADSILKVIKNQVEAGVTLTTVGFGMGNYNDILMEQLANDGDGTYHYVDSLIEAQRIFVENLAGTLQVIARDAKIQVEFNPEVVRSYRLLGYENRRVADDDFRDNSVDAGEIGAGHSVTALYEMKLIDGANGKLATAKIRYSHPEQERWTEIHQDFHRNELDREFRDTAPQFQTAAVVAEYAELLRGSIWAEEGSLEEVYSEARRVRRLQAEDADVAEFADLVSRAASLWSEQSDSSR